MVFTFMGYDSRGNVMNLIDPMLNTTVTVYAGAGVIVGISTPISLPNTNQEQDYNLDALGNWSTTTITPEGGSPATQTRIHNKLNEVTKYGTTNVLYDHGNNTTPHAWRGNGNIADDGIRTYAYDAFNRLTTVKRKSDGATVGQYTYDALGRRVIKIVSNGGVSLAWSTLGVTQWSLLGVQDWASLPLNPGIANGTTRYLYDGNQCAEELNASNSTTRQFIWGQYIDELIQMKTYVDTGSQPLTAGVYYPLSDLLYRSTALTDDPGDIVEAYDTDAYGNTLIYSGPDSTWFTDDDIPSDQPACEYIFMGRQYDPESQIYFSRARYLQPPLGRFISRDPQLYLGGLNLYQAYDSNPVKYTDPFGKETASLQYQNVSSSEHHNYQVFTAICPAGKMVSSTHVDYGNMEMDLYQLFFLQNGWDLITFLNTVMDALNYDFGAIAKQTNINCKGQPAAIYVYMRTRLVGGGLEGDLYRWWNDYIPTNTSLSLYKQDTNVTYTCVCCKQAGKSHSSSPHNPRPPQK